MAEVYGNNESLDLLHIAVGELKKEFSEASDVLMLYLDTTRELAQQHPEAYEMAREISIIVEPVDSSGILDEDCEAAQAFFMGMVLGLKVAGRLSSNSVHMLREATLPTSVDQDKSDVFAFIHTQGQLFMEKGYNGYVDANEFHWIFEEYEDELVSEVTKQTFLKNGFGMALAMTSEVSQRIDRQKEIDAELEGIEDFDWDTAFRELS